MNSKLSNSVQIIIDNSKSEPQQRINLMVEEAVKLTNSNMGYLAVLTDNQRVLIMLGWSKIAMANCSIFEKPMVYPLEQTGLWGDAIREAKPVITNDYENCERITKKGYPDGHVQVIRHANIPLIKNNKIFGVLGVGNKESDYTSDDMNLLVDFSARVLHIVNPEVPNEL